MSDLEALDAFEVLQAAMDAVAAEFDAHDPDAVIDAVQSLDQLANMLEARRAQLFTDIASSGAHLLDGHANARVAVRHMGKLSNATSLARQRNARMAKHLESVAAAWAEGTLGNDHVTTLGRVWANPRVRPFMADAQEWLLAQAAECETHRAFDELVSAWARLVDQDGPKPNERNHEGRRFKLTRIQCRNHQGNAPFGRPCFPLAGWARVSYRRPRPCPRKCCRSSTSH